MKMKGLLVVAVMLASLSSGAPPAFAVTSTNCLDSLEGHSYQCELEISSFPGSRLPVDLSFSGGVLTAGATSLSCSCAAGGSFNRPTFNASKTKWTCVGVDPGGPTGIEIQGTVGTSGVITKVTGADSEGRTYLVGQCQLQ